MRRPFGPEQDTRRHGALLDLGQARCCDGYREGPASAWQSGVTGTSGATASSPRSSSSTGPRHGSRDDAGSAMAQSKPNGISPYCSPAQPARGRKSTGAPCIRPRKKREECPSPREKAPELLSRYAITCQCKPMLADSCRRLPITAPSPVGPNGHRHPDQLHCRTVTRRSKWGLSNKDLAGG
jgi:hypothetical protein